MTVVPEEPAQLDLLRDAFAWGAKLKLDADLKQSVIDVEQEIKKKPIKGIDMVPYSIGRVSEVFNNAPEIVMRQDVEQAPQKNPKNLLSGLAYGSWSFLKGIGSGIGGVVYEPYKGAKRNGVKGATIGVGKGIIGLVAKPVGGTFGLVQYTVQGTINTPGTVGRGIKKAFKKNPKKGQEPDLSASNLGDV